MVPKVNEWCFMDMCPQILGCLTFEHLTPRIWWSITMFSSIFPKWRLKLNNWVVYPRWQTQQVRRCGSRRCCFALSCCGFSMVAIITCCALFWPRDPQWKLVNLEILSEDTGDCSRRCWAERYTFMQIYIYVIIHLLSFIYLCILILYLCIQIYRKTYASPTYVSACFGVYVYVYLYM